MALLARSVFGPLPGAWPMVWPSVCYFFIVVFFELHWWAQTGNYIMNMSSVSSLSCVPGCWDGPSPAGRHGSKGGHPRCHPGRKRRGGPDCHICGHLKAQFRLTQATHQGPMSVCDTREVNKCIEYCLTSRSTEGQWCYGGKRRFHF